MNKALAKAIVPESSEAEVPEPTTPMVDTTAESFVPDLSAALALEADARLQQAEEEFDEAVRLFAKYDEHLTWRSRADNPTQHHLVPKYEALVAETRQRVMEAAIALQLGQLEA